jgi:hypothetical protein
MYRTFTFLSLLYSLGTALNAQDIETHEYFQIETNKTAYAFGDNINVRDAPNTTGKVVTQLKAGTSLKILDVAGDKLALRGIEVPWVKVQFLQNGKSQQGYIWSGLLALDRVVRDGFEFLLGLTRIEDNVYFQEVRIVKQGTLLATKEYKSNAEDGHEFGFEVLGNKGVPNINNVIRVYNYMPACLHWTGFSIFLWDGKTLAYMGFEGGTINVGESWDEIDFIFPEDKGGKQEEGWIVKKVIKGQEDEIGNSVETITTTVWVWDGKQLVHKKEE